MKPLLKRIERLEQACAIGMGRVISLMSEPCEKGSETIELAMASAGLTPQPNDFHIINWIVSPRNEAANDEDQPDHFVIRSVSDSPGRKFG